MHHQNPLSTIYGVFQDSSEKTHSNMLKMNLMVIGKKTIQDHNITDNT